ncbi:MAG TPA: type VI secretion system baseplate subunit TssK [Gemmataceae bacterium]|nr:type VI secretion system baseplate subunit TssK [Gemmataceae bacterium]
MTARAVHWHEGMFLRPHHLQAAQRHSALQQHTANQWDHPFHWGLRLLEYDRDALANQRLLIRTLRARLRDGTLISLPEDGELPVLDLKTALPGEGAVTVFLGVPVIHLGRPNIAAGRNGEGRYVLDTLDLEDENTGLHPQPIQVRRLNLQLLLSTQDHAGYEVLPLASLEKSAGADPAPQIYVPYIPPLLSCDAWTPLQVDLLQSLYDRIGRKIASLVEQVTWRRITLESNAQGDALIIAQLRCLNEAYALLNILAFAPGLHPFVAYCELCRLVGQLAIFGDTRRPPDLPRYDHDDLGGCFYAVKRWLDFLLDSIEPPSYEQRTFVGAGKRMQVTLEQKWLLSHYQMYVGVKSRLSDDDSKRLLQPGGLDMKIGSSENVDAIFMKGAPGLRFQHKPTPPRVLPAVQGLIYFEVSRDAQEWQNVQKSLTLAIRLNEHRIAGNIEGQKILNIKTGPAANQTTPMEFTLYVVEADKK